MTSHIQRIFVAFTVCATVYGDDTWPQFRGPTGDGVSTERCPTEWSEETNVDWKAKIEGIAWSQPIVWKQHVYLTTAVSSKQPKPVKGDTSPGFSLFSGGGLSRVVGGGTPADIDVEWKLICLDYESGERKWEKSIQQGQPAIAIHRSNSYASETPITDGEHLYVQIAMSGLWCFDMDGNEVWSKKLPTAPIMFGWGSGASALLTKDTLVLVCDNERDSYLVAFDRKTGEELWRVERDEATNWSTPYLWKNEQRTEIVICGGGKTRSYDPDTGKVLWSVPGNGRSATTAVGNQNLVIVGSVTKSHGKSGALIAVKAGASGELELEHDSVAWSIPKKSPELSSPLLIGDFVYTLGQLNGAAHCFDAKTGELHFRERLPGAGVFTASPWTDGKHVFCLDGKGNTFVLDPGTELKLLRVNKLDGMFWSSPAIAGGSVLLRSVEHLYRVSEN